MQKFLIKEIANANMANELDNIGFDKTYVNKATSKFKHKNFKIFNLTPAQANILKQTALSVGADCATHRDVITGKAELSNCILGGNLSQLDKIANKLNAQPFGLKDLGNTIHSKLKAKENTHTKIMGILNLTQNSFSDGGKYFEYDNAIKHLNELIEDGADIIDLGAESTKPYSQAVPPEKQLEKLIPILKYIKANSINIPISIDTRSANVANECIKVGVSIINDVSGFDYDENMVKIIANTGAKIIIQHSKGTPENMQDFPTYENLMDEIYINLKNKVEYAISNGINRENIIIDPGIGFGKTKSHNIEIIQRWQELKTIGCPIMIGLSRKSLLEIPDAPNGEKDLYSLALNSILINEGVDFIRVHNVKIHKRFMQILNG